MNVLDFSFANLIDFWNNGGTVTLFPGANLKIGSINNFLQQLQLPIIQKLVSQNARINKLNYKDPFFKGVFEKEKDNLSLPAISKFYLTNSSTQTGSLDIIQLQNGKPLFIRTDGEKQAYFYTSSLSSDFGSFTSDILFTTILLRMGELSLRNSPAAIIGEEAKFPIYAKITNDKAIHLKGNETDFIPKTERNSGVTYIDLSGTEAISNLKAGIYSIVSDRKLGEIALNYNRKESNIAQYTKEDINQKLTSQGIEKIAILEVNSGASVTNLSLDKPYPYWKFFVLATILLLIAEIAVIKLLNSGGNIEVKQKAE